MGPIEQARALINSWLGRGNTDQPLIQPTGNAVNTKWGQIPFKGPTSLGPKTVTAAEPSAIPMPIQQPQGNDGFVFDYNTIPRDEYYAQNGPRANFKPNQPPSDIAKIIRDMFPNEATAAALIASTENAQFAPSREDAVNYDKSGKEISRDRGLMQVNNNTFATEMAKFGNKLRAQGINSYEDMYDPKKNAAFSKHLLDTYGSKRWFGWQDTGYDLNKGWFSAPLRGMYAENKKTMSNEQALKKARADLGAEKKGKK